ncbi:MAG TPA: hypothetical protein VLA02_08205 [Reyranella sp.]|nr:hypothetical protein [Reyranella sp.]
MHSTLHVVAAAALIAMAACSSNQQAESPVQRPGELPQRASGLHVPPDAWEHPSQVASAAGRS